MTERLYYTDPYLTEFDATITAIEQVDGRPAAILDRTAFYPTSGGQPFDTGRLGEATVVDVVDADGGAIMHVLDRGVAVGPVHGRIDWARRFEHMQQHTGQHLLSAAFDRLLGVRTESFHLGAAASTIDLARLVSPREIDSVEDEANRIVWEDRPIAIRFADAAEAAALPLRKESARAGQLRIIEVEDFDVSACGGTHVARTGAVGIIAVTSSERLRGGSRVEFACGGRALRTFRALRDTTAASVRLISVLPNELPGGIERLQADVKDTRRQLKDAQSRLAVYEAAELAGRAVPCGAARLVVEALDGRDQAALKTIATAIATRPGHIAVLFGVPSPAAVVVARSEGTAFDSGAALKRLLQEFGGRGGGRQDLAQGGGLNGTAEALVTFARQLC